jgi:tetratricopeptide (TPR) repeat protein
MGATATDRFSRREFLRLLDITDKQLAYWEKLGIVSPRKAAGDDFYDFRDLISLRTAKQLIQSGVSANRLRLALAALNQKLSKVEQPLTELRILSNGRDIIVDHDGAHLEPISGQFVLNFDTRELRDKVRVMPERNANDWFALALQYESDPETHLQAIDAYRRVLAITPTNVEALINLGMLSYEQGDLENASACFLRAVTGDPNNSVAHFNLGSVLDELGHLEAARRHLRVASHRPQLRRRPLQPRVRLRQARLGLRSPPALAALHPPRPHQPLVRLRPPAPRLAATLTRTLHCCASACRG